MRIEVLYFAGCPTYEALLLSLRTLLAREGLAVEIEERPVETLEAAERERFLGSPTVRVGGVDIEPGADNRTDYGLKCRLYKSPAGLSRLPPEAWLIAALNESQRST